MQTIKNNDGGYTSMIKDLNDLENVIKLQAELNNFIQRAMEFGKPLCQISKCGDQAIAFDEEKTGYCEEHVAKLSN